MALADADLINGAGSHLPAPIVLQRAENAFTLNKRLCRRFTPKPLSLLIRSTLDRPASLLRADMIFRRDNPCPSKRRDYYNAFVLLDRVDGYALLKCLHWREERRDRVLWSRRFGK
jgi:hypothetical protein